MNKFRIYSISISICVVFVSFLINSSPAQSLDYFLTFADNDKKSSIQYPASAQNEKDSDTDSNESEKQPNIIQDSNLKIKVVVQGLEFPTTMAFIGPDDLLVLEKNSGKVKRIINGVMLQEPLLDVNVANKVERGMLGIAVAKHQEQNNQRTYLFLYFSEAPTKDGDDVSEHKQPLGNRLYRYELVDNKLINPKLLLDLPLYPAGYHNGGKISIGPDNNIYIVVGDGQGHKSKAHNYLNGTKPDGRGGILRITQNGAPVDKGILGDSFPLNLYYGYGIRNSFGISFDPVTGILWDTENGDHFGDEINLVPPGFNSGWKDIQGVWEPDYSHMTKAGAPIGKINLDPENLVDFNGKGKYSPPEFTWKKPVGPTAIKFLPTDKLGKEYKSDLFVGDVNNGYIYHFDLNKDRTELVLTGNLSDKVADTSAEIDEANRIFGGGFGRITDIEVGPYDGYLYVVSIGEGKIFRVAPTNDND